MKKKGSIGASPRASSLRWPFTKLDSRHAGLICEVKFCRWAISHRHETFARQLRLFTGPHSVGRIWNFDLQVSPVPEKSVWPGLGTHASGGGNCRASLFSTPHSV